MRSLVFVALACALLAACAPDDATGSTRAPIINGIRETGLREVVAVGRIGGGGSIVGLCSGTVIGVRTVLTAKHCVFSENSDGTYSPLAASMFRVIVGDDVTRSAGIEYTRDVSRIDTTPGVLTDEDFNTGRDIAILTTSSNIGTPRREVARARPRPGNPLEIVGFGRTSASSGASGIKYRGDAMVSEAYIGVFESMGPQWTCQGDSGGPAFDGEGRVVGITSFGTDRSCATDTSYYTETAQNIDLIASALGVDPPCTATAETCDGSDNDCDGVVDQGCAAVGDRCGQDAECESGMCRLVDDMPVCVESCRPTLDDPECSAGYVCEVTGCDVGQCVEGSAGAGAADAPCTDHGDCASNYCFEDVDGSRFCARQCEEGGEPCPTGRVCYTDGFPCGACEVPDPGAPLPFGSACTDGAMCEGGECVGGSCSRACATDDECTGEFRCAGGVCVRGAPVAPGDVCTDSLQCVDTAPLCTTVEGEMVCVAPCPTGTCAGGDECVDGVCRRPGLDLGAACGANPECRSGICAGTCTRLCDDSRPCPSGFVCNAAGMVSGCFSAGSGGGDGGCAVARPSSQPSRGVALAVAAFVCLLSIGRRSYRKR